MATGAEVVLVMLPVAVRIPGNDRPICRVRLEWVVIPGHNGPQTGSMLMAGLTLELRPSLGWNGDGLICLIVHDGQVTGQAGDVALQGTLVRVATHTTRAFFDRHTGMIGRGELRIDIARLVPGVAVRAPRTAVVIGIDIRYRAFALVLGAAAVAGFTAITCIRVRRILVGRAVFILGNQTLARQRLCVRAMALDAGGVTHIGYCRCIVALLVVRRTTADDQQQQEAERHHRSQT